MAIVSFWSSRKRETNQSISAIISAMQMGLERNLKIVVIDTSFSDDTYIDAFNIKDEDNFVKNLNRGKIDISSGVEGLILAVTSNKSTPEIIKNYTTPMINQERCDILYPMKTKNLDTYKAGFANYPEIVDIANKYYDIVYVDLPKGYGDKATTKILAMSDLIVTTFDQDIELIKDFEKLWGKDPLFSPKDRVIPLLTKEDRFSAEYNNDNVARMIRMSPGMPSIIYNTQLMEAAQNGKVGEFLFNNNLYQSTRSRNAIFMEALSDLNMLIIDRIQQQKYKGAFNKMSIDETIKGHIMYMSKEKIDAKETLTEEEKKANENIEAEIINSNKTGVIENKETEAQINKDISENKETFQKSETGFLNEIEKVPEKTNDLGSNIKNFFKNIFNSKVEEKNKNENEKEIENKNETVKEEQTNLNPNQIEEKHEKVEEAVEEKVNQDQNQNQNDLDQMSKEAAKNITESLSGTREVDDAISETEKIMLENKELLEQLKKANEEKKGKEKSTLDFSNIKPLNKQDTDKSKLYSVDDDGKIDYDLENKLMDESVEKVTNSIEEKHQIDFTKIRPLSEEKDEIAKQKYEEIQKEIKAKLMNSAGPETKVLTQTEKLKQEQENKAKEEQVEEKQEIKEEKNEEESPVFNPILGFGGDDEEDKNEETIDDLI